MGTLVGKIHEYHQNISDNKQWMIVNYIGDVFRKTNKKYELQLTHVVNGCNLDHLDPPLIKMVSQTKCEVIGDLKL